MFWVRLSSVFSLSSVHLYLHSASYGTMCFDHILILYFAFFLSKCNRFLQGFGKFIWCSVSYWKIHRRNCNTEEPLGKNLFWVSDGSFLLKNSLQYLYLPSFITDFIFRSMTEATTVCHAWNWQSISLPFFTSVLPFFLLYQTLLRHPALKLELS